MKTCSTCAKKFKPSSSHNNCPSCRYHISKTVMCKLCKSNYHSPKYNNCRGCTNTIRPDYGTGRYKRKNGYIMMYSKGHPRGSSRNYVFEHIVVMEKHIGRYLERYETVHHKNGQKDDNSIENLELWAKPQPSGIRAADALAWARKTLALYEPVEEKL